MNKNKLVGGFIIGTFVMLYVLVSLISTIHVIDFFELSNPKSMAIALAVAFEVGAAASLASLITLDKMNKTLVWALFIAITAMQMQGNMYYAFQNLEDYESWSQLFNLIEEEPLFQKRILAFVSGAILPLVALGFIKSLVDYIKPEGEMKEEEIEEPGKLDDPVEAVEDDTFDWGRFEEEAADDDDLWAKEDEEWVEDEISQEEWNNIVQESEEALLKVEEKLKLAGEYFEQKAQQRENYQTDELLNQEHEDEELFDEDHALDQVMNDMVEDLEEDVKPKDVIDLVNSKEANQDKIPQKDLDASFKFGKNLYDTMVKKVNTDHLQVDSKPSQEEITKAYKNLGLINKNKR